MVLEPPGAAARRQRLARSQPAVPGPGNAPGERHQRQRARALNGAGALATEQSDFAAAMRYHQEGLALRRALGDQAGAADILHNMALTAALPGRFRPGAAVVRGVAGHHRGVGRPGGKRRDELRQHRYHPLRVGRPGSGAALAGDRVGQRRGARMTAGARPTSRATWPISCWPRATWRAPKRLAQESVQDVRTAGRSALPGRSAAGAGEGGVRPGRSAAGARTRSDRFGDVSRPRRWHGIANVLQLQAWLVLSDPDESHGKNQVATLIDQAYSLRLGVPARTLTLRGGRVCKIASRSTRRSGQELNHAFV